MSGTDGGSFATNEYVLLAFFGLSTLAFLWYMYKVIVEYQNMDPKDFEDDASDEGPEVELQDFTVEGRDFYGPGSSYEVLAGRDASLGLASMETDEAKWPKKATMDELTGMETDTLNDWLQRFEDKYPLVGFLPEGFDGRTLQEMTEAAHAQAHAELQEEEAAALAAAGSDSGSEEDTDLRKRGTGGRTYADAAAAAVDATAEDDKDKAE